MNPRADFPLARNERGRLLARYAVKLQDGRLAHYRRLRGDESVSDGSTVWHAYLEVQSPCGGWNFETLNDPLNPAATRRFIEVTHERYFARFARAFG